MCVCVRCASSVHFLCVQSRMRGVTKLEAPLAVHRPPCMFSCDCHTLRHRTLPRCEHDHPDTVTHTPTYPPTHTPHTHTTHARARSNTHTLTQHTHTHTHECDIKLSVLSLVRMNMFSCATGLFVVYLFDVGHPVCGGGGRCGSPRMWGRRTLWVF